jgi:apolipoprotein N-acyltransferase
MHMPDIWSLLTGIASLISLFVSVGERFAAWRKYTLPTATAFGGFAVGRISPALSSGFDHLLEDPKVTGFILILFMAFAALVLVACLLMRRRQEWYAFLLLLLGFSPLIYVVMPMYSKILDGVPPGDLIKLAQLKTTSGEYEQAIRYLESAKNKTDNDVLKNELQRQIDALAKEMAKISVDGKAR